MGTSIANNYTQRIEYLELPTRKVGYLQPYIDSLIIPKPGMSFAGKFRTKTSGQGNGRSIFLGNTWANQQVILCMVNNASPYDMSIAYCSWWNVSATNDLGVADQYVNETVFSFKSKLTENDLIASFNNLNTEIVNTAVTPQYWINGQKYKSGSIQQSTMLILCGRKLNGTQPYGGVDQGGRVYWLKFWDENDELIRDFIPVRIGSRSTGYGCLYDRVSRKLFLDENINQGVASTPFVMGPDGP